MGWSRRVAMAAAVAATALATTGCWPDGAASMSGDRAAVPAPAATQKTAQTFSGVPQVGALFIPGGYPMLHTCTASVVRSRHGDVIMTAAHCITGKGTGYRFAPGYHDGKTPYGVWSVTAAYGAHRWISRQDPRRDWAFLLVAPREVDGRMRSLQSVTGAHALGATAAADALVTVIGYGAGANDQPLRCTTRVYRHDHYPAFDCGGYPGGTSGSPWLRQTDHGVVVSGDIGGLHQGGCTPDTSYSPPLGRPAHLTWARASRHGPADLFPPAGSDGCT